MSLDATVAGADADSYLTVAAADALADADLGPEVTSWLGADEGRKEAALKRATREIDGYLSSGWARYSTTQALEFPREADIDSDDDPVIPPDIKSATYQQAIYVQKNADALAAANVHRTRSDGSEPGQHYAVDPSAGPAIICPMALHYLSGYKAAGRPGGNGLGSTRLSGGFVGTY